MHRLECVRGDVEADLHSLALVKDVHHSRRDETREMNLFVSHPHIMCNINLINEPHVSFGSNTCTPHFSPTHTVFYMTEELHS